MIAWQLFLTVLMRSQLTENERDEGGIFIIRELEGVGDWRRGAVTTLPRLTSEHDIRPHMAEDAWS